jgi:hypothetical protein
VSGETLEQEWKRLCAERRMLRDRIAESASGLAQKARDPLGLRRLIRRHPLAAALTAAGGAAVISALLAGRKTKRTADAADEPSEGWGSVLRRAASDTVGPWLARFIQSKFAAGPADGTQPHETDGDASRATASASASGS